MNTLLNTVQKTVQTAYNELKLAHPCQVELEYCDMQFGHFSTNVAMVMANKLEMTPAELAEKLSDILRRSEIFQDVVVLKPGFVNITLSSHFLLAFCQGIAKDIVSYVGKPGSDQTMVIDYSHPNIGKPMGAHHLLSTVLGDAIKLSYRQLGYNVIADNFIGDLGTQFGKLIVAVKKWGDMQAIDKNPVPELLKLYVQFHIEAERDAKLDDQGRAEYLKLEQGDPENRVLLEKIQSWSKAEMQQIYDFLGIEFDYMNGESFYEDKIAAIIELGMTKKLFVKSKGALICELDNPDEPPALLQKSDGASLYLTRDLARIAYWQQEFTPDIMVNVVDYSQSLQMSQVYEVADKLKLTTAKNIHVSFGRMNFKDGTMSTRKGNMILITDVIEETKNRVRDQIVSLSKDLSDKESDALCDILSKNCLKYSILRQNRNSDITFDWNTMLSLEGNSAPYLAYSAVRMQTIETKSQAMSEYTVQDEHLTTLEQEILLAVAKCPEVFARAVSEFQPSIIAQYCYGICKLYNSFYNKYPIINENKLNRSRGLINELCLNTVSLAMSSLGLKIPTKM